MSSFGATENPRSPACSADEVRPDLESVQPPPRRVPLPGLVTFFQRARSSGRLRSVLVGVAMVLPLASIVQSIQPDASDLKSVGGAELVMVRGEYLPITTLASVFGLPAPDARNALLVVLEDDGKRAALRVDELVGQQQVVLKSLEANYRKVKGVSGATILGDGRVSFILDAPYLVSLAHAHARTHDAIRGAAHVR